MKKLTKQPKNNKYYIRQVSGGLNGAVAGCPTIAGANVLCNCVGFANGRFNQILNDPDLKGIVKPFKYQLVCNAENFIESAQRQGLKISRDPTLGGIMVWQKGATLGGGDGAGHVAVVEEIYNDGTILTSESGWNAWAFKLVHRNNSNGRWGQNSAYKFRGCIINPSIKDGKSVDPPKLVIDGIGGTETVYRMQEFFDTTADGVISGQNLSLRKYYPSLTAVDGGSGGSPCIKKLQRWVGASQDGVLGQKTVKAWQKKIGVTTDGIFGPKSMKTWQKYLNEHSKPVYPPEPTPRKKYKVIDVSEWQGVIDFAKVKADGVVGVIIRYADGDYVDKYFTKNMTNAKKARLHIGSYIFSRAKTKAQAEDEARRIFNACKKFSPDMPLYIDLEDNSLKSYANTVGNAFIAKIKELGGFPGVYANVNWWDNYLTKVKAPAVWVAQYYKECQYDGDYGMWQYSSSGSVKGISGRVDVNECYVEYWNTKTIIDKEIDACKAQAEWMKNYTYKWQNNPTIEKSKKYGTCVTYVACVLQRIGVLKSGEAIWHNRGKVDGANNKVSVSYPGGTVKSNKSKLKRGDILITGDKSSMEAGGNSHIFILNGTWNGGNPYIWDNNSASRIKKGKSALHTFDGTEKVIALIRIKQ